MRKYGLMKRLADVTLSVVALCALLPVLVLTAVVIRLTSAGPVIFRQRRIGVGCRTFEMYKFRTMCIDAPPDVPTHLLAPDAQTFTPVGRFLRRTSLDELPQLWNVLVGDMSLIGPRPALWNQSDLVAERERYAANDIRPGITGWAQVNGRDDLSIGCKAALDGYYALHMSLGFDLRIVAMSVVTVLRGDGVVDDAVASIGSEDGAGRAPAGRGASQ